MSDNQNNTDKQQEKINMNSTDKQQGTNMNTGKSQDTGRLEIENETSGISYYGTMKYRKNKSFPTDLTLSETTGPTTDSIINGPIDVAIPTDSFSTLYDEFQNTIVEVGFEDKIRFSNDFKPTDIKIKKEDKKYTVYGRIQQATQENSTTISYHSFEYVREFNRKMKNIEIEVGMGVASVYGEFDD